MSLLVQLQPDEIISEIISPDRGQARDDRIKLKFYG